MKAEKPVIETLADRWIKMGQEGPLEADALPGTKYGARSAALTFSGYSLSRRLI